jgi:3,4-dihydroxy 2-butanone 4-phosphate synthase/GTP cyclohydrolase II
VDLAVLAGLEPAGVICEIMRDDGEMARMPDLERFARQHGLMIVTIADLITYRLQSERIVKPLAQGTLRPGILGPGQPFAAHLYAAEVEDTEYLALVRGDLRKAAEQGDAVLVRVQSLCAVGDPFGARPDLGAALAAIDAAGVGVFLYVYNKARTSLARSFERQVQGATAPEAPVPSDALRDFGLGAQVLADLGCKRIRLMSNTDRKIVGIQGFGIEVIERVPIPRANIRTLVALGGRSDRAEEA